MRFVCLHYEIMSRFLIDQSGGNFFAPRRRRGRRNCRGFVNQVFSRSIRRQREQQQHPPELFDPVLRLPAFRSQKFVEHEKTPRDTDMEEHRFVQPSSLFVVWRDK